MAFDAFAGLTAQQADEVRRHVLAVMSGDRWSVTRIRERITPILDSAGVAAAKSRADIIARTESAAILSEYRVRKYRAEEEERGKQYLYRMSGVKDHRRTKLSWWIQEQVGDGKPLDDVLRIMDDGIEHAKAGAFWEGGSLAGTQGQPIRLPAGFRRRGQTCHFQDRDQMVRTL